MVFMKNYQSKEVTLKIATGEVKENVTLMAYVVDNNGKLIETATFKKDSATLKQTRGDMNGQQRIYLAQPFPKEFEKRVNERELVKAGAYQIIQSFKGSDIFINKIPPSLVGSIICLHEYCRIEGNISNMLPVNGEPVISPVCNARVHIEQVETRLRWPWPPIWYDRIPEWVIDEIRDRLLHWPPPPPDPQEQIGVQVRENIQVPRLLSISGTADRTELLKANPILPIPEELMQNIRLGSRETLIQTLADNHLLFIPYFCRWEWFWPWLYYIATEESVVYTDCNGNFESWEIFFSCNPVLPLNIYIWVEVFISGAWVTVYRPWLPCGTHWSYACGSPIIIDLQNSRIPPCSCEEGLSGAFVQMDSLTGGATIRSIRQSPTASGHLGNAVGLGAFGGYGNISPFGGSFSFRLYFGSGLHGAVFNGKTITHYRWSYTRIKDAYLQNVIDGVHYLNSKIDKDYWYYLPAAGGGFERIDRAFNLGPTFLDPANHSIPAMYKIPHGVPDQDDPTLPADAQGFPFTDSIEVDSNLTPTDRWADGLYEFTFELLDDYGNVVPIPKLNCPFLVQALPADVNPDSATAINADGLSANGYAENYVIHDGTLHVIGFNFQMRIDNTSCYAGISNALVAGHSTDTECGTGTYTPGHNDQVELIFQAGHPNNFATYSFDVFKGNSGAIAEAGSAGVSANAKNAYLVATGDNSYHIVPVSTINSTTPINPVNPVVDMDEYYKVIPVSDMLGNCITAAFSENLTVHATHTNGVSRLDEYDAGYIAAIAISPVS
jgi:hypothetical protein